MTLRIHHLMTTYRGGAGQAARRIIEAQLAIGLHAQSFSGDEGPAPFADWQKLAWPRRGPARHFWRHWMSLAKRGKPRSFELLSPAVWGGHTPLPQNVADCDVLHLHWVGGRWIDFPSFTRSLPPGLPVVWTLHDLHPLLALSHYFETPARQVADPSVESHWLNVLGRGLVTASWRAKEAFIRERKVSLVAISEWENEILKRSPLGRAAAGHELIHYPIAFDPTALPLSRAKARQQLGLDPDESYVLLGAESVDNPRKGFALAFEALRKGVGDGVRAITFGKGQPHERDAALIDRAFGFISDPQELHTIYAAADVFVTPALQEAFGLTGIEALSNGTPVVCFDQTGSNDYVVDGVNGAVALEKTSESLRGAIQSVLANDKLSNQQRIQQHFASELWPKYFRPENQAERYKQLYRKLVDRA